jgi:hypothetical protein
MASRWWGHANSSTYTLSNITAPHTVSVTFSAATPWVTNGQVSAIVTDPVNHLVYLGGSFTQVGPRTGDAAPVDLTTGLSPATFAQVLSSGSGVAAVVGDGSGGWYIGGSFTAVGGVAISNLARQCLGCVRLNTLCRRQLC